MRVRSVVFVLAAGFAALPLFAKDVYLAVAGSVGAFRTDARIFNPSQSKDIQIQAWFLPVGTGAGTDNSAVQPLTISVPKRQMAVYNDVVSSLFHASGLGAIRLSSADDFAANERVYSTSTCGASSAPCTLGQGLIGVDVNDAKKNGVLLQLGQSDSFRTNIAVVNPNATTANVVWRVYDKGNAVAGQPQNLAMPPYAAVIAPLSSFGQSIPSTADLSDSWIGFSSDQPLIAWAGVNDNVSTDSTSIPALNDSDPPPQQSTSAAKEFAVTLHTGHIDISPDPTGLKIGDQVIFHVSAVDPKHGFQLVDGDGNVVIGDIGQYDVGPVHDYPFTIAGGGTWGYFCTNTQCSTQHSTMNGTFDVGDPGSGPTNPKY